MQEGRWLHVPGEVLDLWLEEEEEEEEEPDDAFNPSTHYNPANVTVEDNWVITVVWALLIWCNA